MRLVRTALFVQAVQLLSQEGEGAVLYPFEQFLLASPVMVNGRFGNSQLSGDLVDGGPRVPLYLETTGGGFEYESAPLLEGPDAQRVRRRIRPRSPWTTDLAFRTLQSPPPSTNRLTGRSALCSVPTTSLPTGQLFLERAKQGKSCMGAPRTGKGTRCFCRLTQDRRHH